LVDLSRFILSLDSGTTSARAILYDEEANIKSVGRREFTQYYPEPGWVEHNPSEIWNAQISSARDALAIADIDPGLISGIGITNQRETTILWSKYTHKPVYNAIVWQCRRTSDMVEQIKKTSGELIKEKTGLIPDSYFSAPKIAWILDKIEGAKEKALRGELLFGTVDSFLLYMLTKGEVHSTDPSNASRTLLFNINQDQWDPELLELFNITDSLLPEVNQSSKIVGYTEPGIFGCEIPIAGIIGDQQGALFGHKAVNPGDSKCTYGTGNFLLMNTGNKPVKSDRLLSTIAWKIHGKTSYALEGSVFSTGAVIKWLRDELNIINNAMETENLAYSIPDNGGVFFVPAFTGLGAPHWDQYARGQITGLTRGTSKAHLVRAALESIAFQTYDLMESMQRESSQTINRLNVDGGASQNNFLMQFQSNILGVPVIRPTVTEATSRGTAFLAGLALDTWKRIEDLPDTGKVDVFEPNMDTFHVQELLTGWRVALGKTLSYNVSNHS
jgi:glycerol kinase